MKLLNPWSILKTRILFDFPTAAIVFWVILCGLGLTAAGTSLIKVLDLNQTNQFSLIGWCALAVLVGTWPIKVPRMPQSFVIGDSVVFVVLLLFGTYGASFVAAVESATGSFRSSRRFSTWASSAAAAACAAFVSSHIFETINEFHRFDEATWRFVSLFPAVLAHWAIQTILLSFLVKLKYHKPFNVNDWLTVSASVGALQLSSALVAAVMVTVASILALPSVLIIGLFVLSTLILVNEHLHRQAALHQENERTIRAAHLEALQQKQQINHLAFHDPLTNLTNRRRLGQIIDELLNEDRVFALLYIDINRFKLVNDSLGYKAGDELLRIVSDRITTAVRPIDIVSRVGGDEFCVVLIDGTEDIALATATAIRLSLIEPVIIRGTQIRPFVAIGISLSCQFAIADEILVSADLAMHHAKNGSGAQIVLYDQTMSIETNQRLQLETDLRLAIENRELQLQYQPLIDLLTSKIIGFEALCRWTKGGVSINPNVFIRLAEESQLILRLTEFVISETIQQLARWRDLDVVIHVNTTWRDIESDTFAPFVKKTLIEHNVQPFRLVLELTESSMMHDRVRSLAELRKITDLGVGLSIDDFGTGYSSLSYLSTLPFDCLKIDQSFVLNMPRSIEHKAIISTIITLAQSLRKSTIAEGIETPEQLELLRCLGVSIGQGFLFSKAVDESTALDLLLRQR